MKISNEVKILLALGVVVLGYRFLRGQSKKIWQTADKKSDAEKTKGFLNLTASNATVIGGVQYTCPTGQEVLVDGSGNVGCYLANPDGDLIWQGRPRRSQAPLSSSTITL